MTFSSIWANGMRLKMIRFWSEAMIWRMRRANSLLNGAYTIQQFTGTISVDTLCVSVCSNGSQRDFKFFAEILLSCVLCTLFFHTPLYRTKYALNANYLRLRYVCRCRCWHREWMRLRFCWSVHRITFDCFVYRKNSDKFMYTHDIA